MAYRGSIDHGAQARRPAWLMTAALVMFAVWVQALSPFLMPARAGDDLSNRTLALCTADGYKLVRIGAEPGGDATDPTSIIHCPLCLGAQQILAILPPEPPVAPAFLARPVVYAAVESAHPRETAASGWAEARAPPANA
ncbi:DUF2946 family protein [Oceanibaculum pacificum]|uniref:DUF2946 domain-containing protein n=1 Tax=Oceanibaculum pacificum TaxID=580166 RepID=A0A154WGM6_9PROT|nr:DUF2946 family protein [Oceanibaculum pacificum]KZD12681.1 hypothetical protein AUP43_15530 [Oceanibaculum pacificum]